MDRREPVLPRSTDAVVVVPGIMGSELIDTSGKVCWGLKPSVLARAWLTKNLDILQVTDDDMAGGGRLRPTRLLRVPGYMPFLGGIEPYTDLLRRVAEAAADSRAVAEFPYDWRLSIEYNAPLLVRCCEEHLESWRAVVQAERKGDPADVRLVVVAHSMGGLVTRYATQELGLSALLRQVITLGTPFYGAVKGVQMLATGEGAPLPREAARRLALTCPGVFDLLPRYRCVVTTDGVRRLTVEDIAAIGGSAELAADASQRWERLGLATRDRSGSAVRHLAVVGTEQPTLQSVELEAGEATFLESLAGVNHAGDSTVYRQAAAPDDQPAFVLPQRHGSLAKTPEALAFVADKLVGADTKPPLGTRPVGADIPDIAVAGRPVKVRVTGNAIDPVGVSVKSTDIETGIPTTWHASTRVDGALQYTHPGLPPGLHRIQIQAGGYSPVTDMVLVTAP
jgi:pimeloyl-ACP methyl ester carboxylesterase